MVLSWMFKTAVWSEEEGDDIYREMLRTSRFLLALVALVVMGAGPFRNLSVDEEATKRIQTCDRQFLEAFEVYSAGVREAPLALLLDREGDDYHLPSYLWEEPLDEEEIPYALKRIEEQHLDPAWCLPLPPCALRIVNKKGELLGYIYTSLREIFMQREDGGGVKVFLPEHSPCERDDSEEELWRWR